MARSLSRPRPLRAKSGSIASHTRARARARSRARPKPRQQDGVVARTLIHIIILVKHCTPNRPSRDLPPPQSRSRWRDHEGDSVFAEVLSFIHPNATIQVHPGASLVARRAAFSSPFRSWRGWEGEVPFEPTGIETTQSHSSEVSAVTLLGGPGIAHVLLDTVICTGLKHCVRGSEYEEEDHMHVTNSSLPSHGQ